MDQQTLACEVGRGATASSTEHFNCFDYANRPRLTASTVAYIRLSSRRAMSTPGTIGNQKVNPAQQDRGRECRLKWHTEQRQHECARSRDALKHRSIDRSSNAFSRDQN